MLREEEKEQSLSLFPVKASFKSEGEIDFPRQTKIEGICCK